MTGYINITHGSPKIIKIIFVRHCWDNNYLKFCRVSKRRGNRTNHQRTQKARETRRKRRERQNHSDIETDRAHGKKSKNTCHTHENKRARRPEQDKRRTRQAAKARNTDKCSKRNFEVFFPRIRKTGVSITMIFVLVS